jgi:hypothetical protein
MKTQLIGSNEYAENGDIINAELEKARFIGEWIEHDCNFDITNGSRNYQDKRGINSISMEQLNLLMIKEAKGFYS